MSSYWLLKSEPSVFSIDDLAHSPGPRYVTALENMHENLGNIQEMGVIVKDLELGLCDFPYLLDGRIVYLCWKLGEDKIEWWHEITTGFSERQAIPEGTR